MGFFSKKKNEDRPAVVDMPSLFMNDDSEGDYGKEAMLDYQLSYVLRLAGTYESGNFFGQRVLMKLLGKECHLDYMWYIENTDIISVKVWKQWEKIDLIAEVEIGFGYGANKQIEHHVIVVESKAYTRVHDDQLSRYTQTVEDYYKDKDVTIHYWVISFFDRDSDEFEAISNQAREAKGHWECISFDDLVELTTDEEERGIYNDIIDEFWIKRWS